MKLRAGRVAAAVILALLIGCSHGGHGNKSSGGSSGKQSGNAAMHDGGKNGGRKGAGAADGELAPYVSLPALDPQITYRRAMEYCDVQGKVAVFRGMQLVHQQQMANYDCE